MLAGDRDAVGTLRAAKVGENEAGSHDDRRRGEKHGDE